MKIKEKIKEKKFKTIVLGNSGVGKSTFLSRIEEKEYPVQTQPTVAVDFVKYEYQKDEENIKMLIFDTSGQETYRSIVKSMFNDVSGVLLFYDLNSPATFKDCYYWLKLIHEMIGDQKPVFLIGNKLDIIQKTKNYQLIDNDELQSMIDKYKLKYYQVSALQFKKDEITDIVKQLSLMVMKNSELILQTNVLLKSDRTTKKSGCQCANHPSFHKE